ncbi:MAG: hypothetical protein GX442_03780 [Candidatus Riflebacteria bacterium]|nr:hypothetical protein [Candidatus Riflebacteria bacterium]
MKRRDFLRWTLAGTAAAGLGGTRALLPASAEEAQFPPVPVYRTLGRTGLKVTIVGFGAMLTPEAEVIEAALEAGVNYVDTARKYMDGRNEEIVGRAIRGRRDKIFLATKTRPKSVTKAEIFEDVETSLAKLGTDHIDVIQLHNLDLGNKDRIFNPETRAALKELQQQGKVRFLGVTTHTNQAEILDAVATDPERFFDTVLVSYNFKNSGDVREAVARAAKAGVGIIGMKTQAGGYPTGDLGSATPHQAALKWVLSDTNVATTIPGMKDMAMLREDLSVMGMKFSAADAEALERYGRVIDKTFCRLCAKCEPGCPRGVPISVVNRSLMYAEAYGQATLARETYGEIPAGRSAAACGQCPTCVAHCPNGLDIAAKMRTARGLFA